MKPRHCSGHCPKMCSRSLCEVPKRKIKPQPRSADAGTGRNRPLARPKQGHSRAAPSQSASMGNRNPSAPEGLAFGGFFGYLAGMLRRVADRRPSGFVEPCRPSKAAAPPSGPEWVHEIKHDGFRLLVRREGTRVRCFTRGGYDWADRFPAIVEAASRLRAQSFLIDG